MAQIQPNYDKYAVYGSAYVMGKLELKQREFLFHTLDNILLAVIRGSKYSIAATLKMAALAAEFSEIDLSAKDLFRSLKEKYEGIAVELIKQIESHHLAAIILRVQAVFVSEQGEDRSRARAGARGEDPVVLRMPVRAGEGRQQHHRRLDAQRTRRWRTSPTRLLRPI